MLTTGNVTTATRTYWLAFDGREYTWLCYEDPADGFGPFGSKAAALAFGRKVGRVTP